MDACLSDKKRMPLCYCIVGCGIHEVFRKVAPVLKFFSLSRFDGLSNLSLGKTFFGKSELGKVADLMAFD